MPTFAQFLSGDGYQRVLTVNLDRIAFVGEGERGTVRLHFSGLPNDFIDVLDYAGHLAELGDDT